MMRAKEFKFFILGLLVTVSGSSFAFTPWNSANDPNRLEANYSRQFFDLPKEGWVEKLPWSDSYWPSASRGLAWRWQGASTSYRASSNRELVSMSEEQLRALSPIEKLDVYLGNADPSLGANRYYARLKAEIARTSPSASNPVIDSWEGVCNGWAAASIHHPEPKAVKVPVNLNIDGQSQQILLPFSTSDIKALMSLYYFNTMSARGSSIYRTLGTRCEGYSSSYVTTGSGRYRTRQLVSTMSAECEDTNAGAFHVVLTNQIGLKKESFIADIDPSKEVWNHPVTGYRMNVLGQRSPSAGAARDAVREMVVETTMFYRIETAPHRYPHGSEDWNFAHQGRRYQYAVELDAADRIVGGSWISSDRPDFLWKMDRLSFSGDFDLLNRIVVPSES